MDQLAILGPPDGLEILDWLAGFHLVYNLLHLMGPPGRGDNGDVLANHLARRVAVHPLRALVPARNPASQILADDRILRGFYDRRQAYHHLFGSLARRDVSHINGIRNLLFVDDLRDCNFGGKCAAVGSRALGFEAIAYDVDAARSCRRKELAPQTIPQRGMKDGLNYILAYSFRSGNAKGSLCRRVEIRDPGRCVGANDAVQSKIQQSLPASFTFMERLLNSQQFVGGCIALHSLLRMGRPLGLSLCPAFSVVHPLRLYSPSNS